jgi:hypothetical protein
MPTSTYFNFYKNRPEQNLIEDLMVESIKQYGFDGYYIPLENEAARDLLFGDDPLKKFKNAWPLELYLSNPTGDLGEQEFFSKFGLEIRNVSNVILSKRTFSQMLPQGLYERPREGDLIYIPFSGGQGDLFEIKFVNANKDNFILGRKNPYFYELSLENFKYSQELIDTGIPDIDVVAGDAYTLTFLMDVSSGYGNYLFREVVYQGTDVANATSRAVVTSWTISQEFDNTGILQVSNIFGEFTNGFDIIGDTTKAHYRLVNYDPILDQQYREVYDNKVIQNEANTVVNFSESNPFGSHV